MLRTTPPLTARRNGLRAALLRILLLVQAVVVLTPLAEGRAGAGVVAHVEAQENGHHYQHAEANCAYCVVRTIHAAAVAVPTPARAHVAHGGLVIARAVGHASAESGPPHHSRAPPAGA
jgi:hypothetical protein